MGLSSNMPCTIEDVVNLVGIKVVRHSVALQMSILR